MKKIGLVVLALILALGSLGVGYAKWSDSVTITKQVNTGQLCVNATIKSNGDTCSSAVADSLLDIAGYVEGSDEYNILLNEGKNVACMQVTGQGTNSITVTVYNAYPGYFGDVEVELCNCGTVPVKLESIEVTDHNFDLATKPWFVDPKLCDGAIFVDVTDGVGTQLDLTGTTRCKAASWKFIVQECALQNAGLAGGTVPAYTFTVTWTLSQWNEFGMNPT